MLDADLARIYGYTTKAFNQQVKNNLEKFEGEDFMFQPTKEELEKSFSHRDSNLKSSFLTSSWGGIRKLPYAFTEQGIYMLMTVLHGELAVKQSRALVVAFKRMKDYILENQKQLECRDNLQLAMKVMMNTEDIAKIKTKITELDGENTQLRSKIEEAVMKSEISPIMLDFNRLNGSHEYLFMNGELLEAKEAYQDIYSRAKKSIYIIDDYIDIKTLRLLSKVRRDAEIVVFSDNVGNHLHSSDYLDFQQEFPGITVRFIRTYDVMHDRFIIIDYGEEDETFYHCGASSKDAGKAVTVISEMDGKISKESMRMVINMLMKNTELMLK